MATLKIIGSGSTGNGYVIECERESLVIELGMPFKNYIMSTPMSNVAGALVSHIHGDHLMKNTAARFLKMCIPVYACKDVIESIDHLDVMKRAHVVKPKTMFVVGLGFKVQPIALTHSVYNLGYIIDHREFGRLVFATDTSAFNLKIKNVNHWMIEANYDPEIIIDHKISNEEVRSRYEDHLSKQQCYEVMKQNFDPDVTKTITLIHLSDGNSNATDFMNDLKDELKFDNVYVADERIKTQTINL